MHTPFRTHFEQLEIGRQQIYDLIEPVEPRLLSQAPKPGAWSVLQVMQHLIQTENGSMAYIAKKLHYKTRIPKAGIGTHLRAGLAIVYMRIPIKVKAPAIVANISDVRDPKVVQQEWDEVRQHLNSCLEHFPPEYLDHAVLKHAFAGKITMAHTLRFFIEHQKRHTRQIHRTLSLVTPQ